MTERTYKGNVHCYGGKGNFGILKIMVVQLAEVKRRRIKVFQREFDNKIGKKKNGRRVGKITRLVQRATQAEHVTLAQWEVPGLALSAQDRLSARRPTRRSPMCAQHEVSVKSKLPQAYKRRRKQKKDTPSELSSAEIQSLSLSLRGNPLSLVIPPFLITSPPSSSSIHINPLKYKNLS